jgi:hypothetical protein
VSVVLAFIRAYNAGELAAATAELATNPQPSDCVVADVQVCHVTSAASWLASRRNRSGAPGGASQPSEVPNCGRGVVGGHRRPPMDRSARSAGWSVRGRPS